MNFDYLAKMATAFVAIFVVAILSGVFIYAIFVLR